MAKTKISEFSTTPGDNTDINGINIAEGCAPSGINNAIRELMSDLKEWQSGAMDVYVVPQGTAAAPGIQFYSDTNTGLYRYAADQLGIAVGGVSAGYFSSDGWVGNVVATTIDLTNIEVTNIKAKDGTAAISIADSTGKVTVSSELAVDNLNLSGNTFSSTDTNGNIVLAPNGTGDVYLDADTIRVGDANSNVTVTTNGTGDLILNTNSGTNSGAITIEDGVNGNILIATNGTGQVQLTGDLDVTTVEVTNIKAKDGTSVFTLTDSTGAVSIANAVTMAATTQNIALGTSQTSGTFTVGGAAQTGTQTFDQSTKTHTLNIGTGATESAATKTINIGTGGVATSTTAIAVGSTNGTTITLNGTVNATTVNATTLDLTNLEVTNIKAKDGTASITLADSTGVATLSANPILNAGTANGVVYLNASKSATSGSAVTYDGTTFTTTGAANFATSTGNVGIGTASPGAKLQVVSNTPIRMNNAASTSQADLYFGDSGATLKVENFFGTGSNITLGTNANGAGVLERMRLDSSGNLGIGTSSPGSYNAAARNLVLAGSSSYVGMTLKTSGGVANIVFSNAEDTGVDGLIQYDTTSNYLRFDTNGSERMRLDSSGNLGLGVTPSAWSAYRGLQVGNASVGDTIGGNNALFTSNLYYGGSPADFRYISASATGTMYRQLSGAHSWHTTGTTTGAANGIASPTQAMTLDASGNLLVGTTTANYNLAGRGLIELNGSSSALSALKINNTATAYFGCSASLADIGTVTNIPLLFLTNNTERARITASGYFKASNNAGYVGSTGAYHEFNTNTTGGEYTLWVRQQAATGNLFGININFANQTPNNTTNLFAICGDASATRFELRSNGGLANYSANDVNLASDRRLKNTIEPMRSYYDVFKNINWVTWLYNDQTDDIKNHGVIAQELKELAPEFVCESNSKEAPEGEEPYLGIWEQDFKMAGMSVITELIKKIEQLEAKVAALEGK